MSVKIGLDELHFAEITEDENGYESYGIPQRIAGAITASLAINTAETQLRADGECIDTVTVFDGGTISINVCDIGADIAAKLLGARIDKNGVLVQAKENKPKAVAIGFRSLKSDGNYKFVWLYRVVFGVPATEHNTNGETVSFTTQRIEGKIYRRNRPDSVGESVWKTEFDTSNRITDMAAVMTSYSKNNILVQASQAMLAQANQSEQGVLHLLRGADDANGKALEKLSSGYRINRARDDYGRLMLYKVALYWFSHVYEPDEDYVYAENIQEAESAIRETDMTE